MLTIHATQKLRDKTKVPIEPTGAASTTALGCWYATALFWKPQVALFVNERTLLPVLMPLAPAATLAQRFPHELGRVLLAHGASQAFVDAELAQMAQTCYAKTANRSVLGIMNQFEYLAEAHVEDLAVNDLLGLSLKLSQTPCSPLYKRAVSPERELRVELGGISATFGDA